MPCFVAGHDYREIAEQNAVGVAEGQNSLGTDITFLFFLLQKKLQSVGIEAISGCFFHIWGPVQVKNISTF